MTDPVLVTVELGGSPVDAGLAYFTSRRGVLATSFRYDNTFLARPDAYPLDPSWPLFSGNHHAAGLPGAFRDCSPDRWGRNLILKRHRAASLAEGRTPPVVDDVGFLLGVSDITRQGAVRFRVRADGPYLGSTAEVPKLIELPRLLRASDTVARGDDELAAVKELLDAGSASLGGARPKASISDSGRLHLAKFPHPSDEWDVMAWEKTALDLAERAGLATPRRRSVVVEGRGVLILERFDRRGSARIGYISAMTMLGARDGDARDYVELAETLPEFSSRPTVDLREFWRRIAFSVAVHNTDDHLRNHGFLRTGSGWALSPVFDVNPNPTPGSRVTSIAGGRAEVDEVEGLVAAAPYFRIRPAEIREQLRGVVDAVSTWREVALANGLAGRQLDLFAPMLDDRLRSLTAVP